MKSFYKKYLIGLIIISLVFSSLFFTLPRRANAWGIVFDPPNFGQNVTSAVQLIKDILKEFVTDTLAWTLANAAIERIAQDTVNWVNSGFQGSPTFVNDPKSLLEAAANAGIDALLMKANATRLCYDFSPRIQLAILANRSSTYQRRLTCTMDRLVQNYQGFVNNFLEGGWTGWVEITQPAGNPFGSFLETVNEGIAITISKQDNAVKEANWGSGFMSIKQCTGGTMNILDYCSGSCVDLKTGAVDQDCVNRCLVQPPPQDAEEQCLQQGGTMQTVTPGKAIEDKLNSVLGSDTGRLQVADEINEIIGALFNQLLNRGLRALSGDGSSVSAPSQRVSQQTRLSALSIINNCSALKNENDYRKALQDTLNVINQLRSLYQQFINCFQNPSVSDTSLTQFFQDEITRLNAKLTEINNYATDINNYLNSPNNPGVMADQYRARINSATSYDQIQVVLEDFDANLANAGPTIEQMAAATNKLNELQSELNSLKNEWPSTHDLYCTGQPLNVAAPASNVVTPVFFVNPNPIPQGSSYTITVNGEPNSDATLTCTPNCGIRIRLCATNSSGTCTFTGSIPDDYPTGTYTEFVTVAGQDSASQAITIVAGGSGTGSTGSGTGGSVGSNCNTCVPACSGSTPNCIFQYLDVNNNPVCQCEP
jgi:hypothetical protein